MPRLALDAGEDLIVESLTLRLLLPLTRLRLADLALASGDAVAHSLLVSALVRSGRGRSLRLLLLLLLLLLLAPPAGSGSHRRRLRVGLSLLLLLRGRLRLRVHGLTAGPGRGLGRRGGRGLDSLPAFALRLASR